MTIAPTLFFDMSDSYRWRISNTGIQKAKVFPDPVVASTQTSLLLRNKGIVAACTGVGDILAIPMLFPNASIAAMHSTEREGFKSSNDCIEYSTTVD